MEQLTAVEIILALAFAGGILCVAVGIIWLIVSFLQRIASPKVNVSNNEMSIDSESGRKSEAPARATFWRPLAAVLVGAALTAGAYWSEDFIVSRAIDNFEQGNAYFDSGDFDKAIEKYTKATRIALSDCYACYLAYMYRGTAYDKTGHSDEALADYKKVIELVPDFPYTYAERGSLYQRHGRYEKAIEDYDRAIRLSLPTDTELIYQVYLKRGWVYAELDQMDRARQDFDKAVELRPDFPPAYLDRGYFHRAHEDYEKAIEDFNMATSLGLNEDNLYRVYMERGTAYVRLGQMDRARQDFEKATTLRESLTVSAPN